MRREFVIEVARAFHKYGAPAHRIEDTVAQLAESLGFRAQVLVTPTSLMFAFDEDRAAVRLHRSSEGEVNVGGVARALRVAQDVCAGTRSPAAGIEAIRALSEAPRVYGPSVSIFASAVASGSAACFLATTVEELLLATVLGGVVGVLCGLSRVVPDGGRLLPVGAAVVVASLAAVVSSGRPASPYALTVCALILFVPGLTLTTAMAEAATGHLVAATSRMVGAVTVLLSLAVGVALGDALAGGGFGLTAVGPGTPLPAEAWIPGLLIGAVSFQVLLGAEREDLVWVIGSGAAAAVAILVPVTEYAATFLGALAVGFYGRAYSTVTARPPMVVVVPGILVLVPGSIGFQSVVLMMADDVASGGAAAFRMVIVGMSIALGLLVSGVLSAPVRLRPREDSRRASFVAPQALRARR